MAETEGDLYVFDYRDAVDHEINKLATEIVNAFLSGKCKPEEKYRDVMAHFEDNGESLFYIPEPLRLNFPMQDISKDYFYDELRKDITLQVLKNVNMGKINQLALEKFDAKYKTVWAKNDSISEMYALVLCDLYNFRKIHCAENLRQTLYASTYHKKYDGVYFPAGAGDFINDCPEESAELALKVMFAPLRKCFRAGSLQSMQDFHDHHPDFYAKSLDSALSYLKERQKVDKYTLANIKNFTAKNAKIASEVSIKYSVLPDVLKVCKAYAEAGKGIRARLYLKSLDKIMAR